MHKLAAGLLTVIGFLLCFAAAAPARAAFNMERCMANGEARGLTARRAAFVCHRNSQGKMYRHARHDDLEGLSHAATVTPSRRSQARLRRKRGDAKRRRLNNVRAWRPAAAAGAEAGLIIVTACAAFRTDAAARECFA